MPHHERGSWLAGHPFRTVRLTRPVKVWLTQLPASLDCRPVHVHRIGARPSEA
jgi:hypothetical protein